MLDYGCGKGRILEGLVEASLPALISERIDYFAFDPSIEDRTACLAIIAESYGDAGSRYFNSVADFFQRKDDEKIDVIILCNVFHEISPKDWLSLFSPQSLIMRALKSDGYLLLVEDQRLPVGEKAHEHGFFVLDTEHLKTLFDIKESDIRSKKFVFDDCRGDGRLKAHLVEKSLLLRITAGSRAKAINQLQESAIEQIKQLRGQNATYSAGQLHGFWTQQLANTFLFLRDNISSQ